MKKLFLIVSALFSAASLFAEVVGKDAAASYAGTFFSGGVKNATQQSAKPLELVRETSTYYIYNKPEGGWVIISAEDATEPVLAFSETGSFNNALTNEAFEWWMNGVSGQIEAVRKAGLKRNSSWDGVKKAGEVIVQYTTAEWDQGNPYNLYCPTFSGKKTITGCVATAAAIVCRYHQWPVKVSGTAPKYTYTQNKTQRTVEARTLTAEHDYSLMPLKYNSSATDSQKKAVANLMSDLGCASKMMYGSSDEGGSGAYTEDLVAALKKYFGYKSSAVLRQRSSYSDANWIPMLQQELKDNGPIIYGGSDPSGGGHQFVFDACRDDKYFRVNWGWSGSGNGWFLVTNLGGSTVGYTFSLYQDAIFNLIPDTEGVVLTPEQVAENVRFEYLKKDKSLNFYSTYSISYVVEGPQGFSSVSGSVVPGKGANISLSSAPSGSYKVSLSCGDQPYVFTVKL